MSEQSRPKVITIDAPKHQTNNHHKKQSKQQKTHYSNFVKPIPLELMPAINSMMSYGEQMHALGALTVVEFLERILKKISSKENLDVEFVVDEINDEIFKIKARFAKSYEGSGENT